MVSRRRSSPPPPEPQKLTSLVVPRTQAMERIDAQIESSKPIEEKLGRVRSEDALDEVRGDFDSWNSFTNEMLARIVDTSQLVGKFSPSSSFGMVPLGDPGLSYYVEHLHGRIRDKVQALRTIRQMLDLFPEPALTTAPRESFERTMLETNRRVFVVHGHTLGARDAVARCLTELEFEPVILSEQADRNQTIIEKFERHSDVGFAVVILTPDDFGATTGQEARPRARQNVILELGYFIGKLGRGGVCALHDGNVELPSDYHGVLWTPLDNAGAWRFKLGQELQAAGFDVDLNKLSRRGR